jgi:hypothetical protein
LREDWIRDAFQRVNYAGEWRLEEEIVRHK